MSNNGVDTKLLESKIVLKGFKSRKEFAEKIGTTPHTISNLLNGVYSPSHELMNVIYKELELTPEEGIAIFFVDNLRKTKVITA